MATPASPVILPVSSADAEHCLALIAGKRSLLAVSGGADSMALMRLAAGWARQHGELLHAAVVDHGLRAGSAGEAAFVKEEAARLSLPCKVLRWEGNKPETGLQDAARNARYALLVDHARVVGADAIVTAHTLDDQAETMMIRLAAGSGVAGMAGMQARTVTHGMTHFRPFLGLGKDRLVATCRAHDWRWIEDPSNRNEAFTRVRWRALMPLLAREGLSAERLGVFARRMAETEHALQQMTRAALEEAGHAGGSQGWRIDAHSLFMQPDAVVVRALATIMTSEPDAAHQAHGPRLVRIENCVAAMRTALQAGKALTRTLGGHVLSLKRDGQLVASPEKVRRRGCVNPVHSPSLGNGLPEN